MIRGFMKTSSQTALALAAAGLLMGTYAPAKAADLGGGCCADLEERVAELEATTARKGNRVVSLQVYGQVNKGLLIWDDGVHSDAYVVDNAMSSSRFGFQGKGSIKPGWTAGYNIEFEIQDARSDQVYYDKLADDAQASSQDHLATLRQNHFWVESDRFGRLTMGQASTAADGAYEVNLANSLRTSDVLIGNAFYVQRKSNGGNSDRLSLNSTTPAAVWAMNLDSGRNDVVRYDSPSILGFILSASWGDNDYADVALRFKKEFDQIRVAAAVAYQWDHQYDRMDINSGGLLDVSNNHETFGGAISVMHVPTGLYLTFQGATRKYQDGLDDVSHTVLQNTRADASFWLLQGGVERKFLPFGATTIYGEYGVYSDMRAYKAEGNGPTSSSADRWGFGLNQAIDGTAMDVYAHANFWSFSDNSAYSYEDLSTVIIGSRIKF